MRSCSSLTTSRRGRAHRRGFSLIEIIVAVVIIGILAVLALYSYKRWIHSARLAEATHMVAGIREGQERYKAEVGNYADISTSITATYPSASPGSFRTRWGVPCTTCNGDLTFATISVDTSEPVQFGYATVAGDEASVAETRVGGVSINGANVDLTPLHGHKWYVVLARDDADGDGAYTQVFGTSITTDLMIDETSP